MKLLFFSILLVFTLSTNTQNPPKGTVLIVVKNELSRVENFTKVSRTLLGNGFILDIKDTVHYSLETVKKRLPEYGVNFSMHFIIKDSAIAVYGKLTDAYMPKTLSKQVFILAQNRGAKNSPYRLSFSIMHGLAKKLDGNMYFFNDIEKYKFEPDTKKENDDIYYKNENPSDDTPVIKV